MINHLGRLFDWRILFLGAALIVCALSFAGSPVSGSGIQVKSDVNRELANILSVVQVKANPDLTIEPAPGKTSPLQIFTRDRKYSAYVLCVALVTKEDSERCAHRVYFDDYTGPAKVYEIRGEPELEEVTRPIDGLKWVNDYTLSYERWAAPNFGHRYVIDVRRKKQLTANDLSDSR